MRAGSGIAAARPGWSGTGAWTSYALEQEVRPVFADLPSADVDLWIAANVEGLGWQAAGEAAGMDRANQRCNLWKGVRFVDGGPRGTTGMRHPRGGVVAVLRSPAVRKPGLRQRAAS